MKCEHVLTALAAGGWLSRRRALRHATRCPRCARAQGLLHDLKTAMAPEDADSFDAQRHRNLWLQAASIAKTEPRRPAPRRRLPPSAIAAAAAAAILATGLTSWLNLPPRRIAHPVPDPRSAPNPPTAQTPTIDLDLSAARREIAELRRQADLLDVRRDAERLWERFARARDLPSF